MIDYLPINDWAEDYKTQEFWENILCNLKVYYPDIHDLLIKTEKEDFMRLNNIMLRIWFEENTYE